jgi:flagellin-specific chaperone FliS
MVHAGRAAQHYIQPQVRSSSPLELVEMLYDQPCTSMTDSLVQATVKQEPWPIRWVRRVLDNLPGAGQQIAVGTPAVPESAA